MAKPAKYLFQEDLDVIVEDIHGNRWGLVRSGGRRYYYFKTGDRPDEWVRLSAAKVKQVPSSIIDELKSMELELSRRRELNPAPVRANDLVRKLSF